MGRKLSKARPRQGAKLATFRYSAGLTQAELARLVGEKQQTIAYWEKSTRPPRSDALPRLAKALGISVEDLLSDKGLPGRQSRPAGKVHQLFDQVARLPRRQRDKVVEVVSALVEQYKQRTG